MMSCDMVPSLIQCLHTVLPSRPDLTDLLIIILKKVSSLSCVDNSVATSPMKMFACVASPDLSNFSARARPPR